MNIFDRETWKEVHHTLMSNRKRTFTTAFGVFWGIFVLVILLSIGAGVNNAVSRELRGISTNMGMMETSTTARPYKGFKKGRIWHMTMSDIERIKDFDKDILCVTPVTTLGGENGEYSTLYYGTKKSETLVLGIMGDYTKIVKYNIHSGRFITEADHRSRRPVCAVGRQIAKTVLGGEEEALGKVIRIGQKHYTVIGVVSDISRSVSIMGGRAETNVFLPYSVVDAFQKNPGQVYTTFLSVKDGAEVRPVLDKIKAYLYAKNDIHPDDERALETIDISSIFQFFNLLLTSITILIWFVGFGTIISGIVGVSNILLVTVRERTREIGVRRALGGHPRDIIGQILLEGISITVLSGLTGIILATGIMSLVDLVLSMQVSSAFVPLHNPVLPFGTAIIALLVIILGGLLGGTLPAIRAVNIKPIDAIREE